jgi:hypothetical protein
MAAEAVKPFWAQPSHGEIQEVRYASGGFMTKSYSKIHVPPFGLFAKLEFPPCTKAEEPTYATVQMGRNEHLNLNSDLLYINHGCDPSLVSATFKSLDISLCLELLLLKWSKEKFKVGNISNVVK